MKLKEKAVYNGYELWDETKKVGDQGYIGKVHKSFRFGYIYWQIVGKKQLYSTKKETVATLLSMAV
jgi:hypothetical protein